MWIIGNLQVRSLHQCLNCLLNPGLSSQPSSLSYNLLHRFLFIVSCDQSATFSSHRCFSVWVGYWAPACGLVCCYFICCFGTYFLFHVVYQHPSVPNLHQCLNWLVDPVHLSQSCSLLFYHLHRDSFFLACGLSATFMSQLCICVYVDFWAPVFGPNLVRWLFFCWIASNFLFYEVYRHRPRYTSVWMNDGHISFPCVTSKSLYIKSSVVSLRWREGSVRQICSVCQQLAITMCSLILAC